MSKVCLITDTHYGVRGDIPAVHRKFSKFFNDYFFKFIDQYNIDHIIHLGDLVDKRKQINFTTANELKNNFIQPCIDRNIHLDIIVGNHDCYHKNNNDINAVEQLYGNYNNIFIYKKPTEVLVKNKLCLFIPWVSPENKNETVHLLMNTNSDLVFGHLELVGFEMYKGSVCTHGMESKLFNQFDHVYTGHFHHKSDAGNIHYLGAPYEMIWSDYDDHRGFHVLDMDTQELTFYRNPFNLFQKVIVDETLTTEQVLFRDYSIFEDCFVRVILKNTSDVVLIDNMVERIQAANPIEIQVIDESVSFEINVSEDTQDSSDSDDTRAVINSCIQALETKVDKDKIKNKLYELYNMANRVEV